MNVHRAFSKVSACALALWALAGGVSRADQLAGIIKSVDTSARTLRVYEKTTDRPFNVVVAPNTVITSMSGRPLTMKALRRGDGVGVSLYNGIATVIVVNQTALLGVVESIDLDGKTFTLDEKGTDRDVKVAILPNTTIETPDGKNLPFKDLKSGDGVSVNFNGEDVAVVVVNAKPDEMTGHIKTVAADLKSFVITDIATKREVRVAVTPKTNIVTSEGKTMELRQLKKGDGVGIAHNGSVASKIVVNPAPAQ